MAEALNFYLSSVVGSKVKQPDGRVYGRLIDILVDVSFIKPKVTALKIKRGGTIQWIDFAPIEIKEQHGRLDFICGDIRVVETGQDNTFMLVKHVFDKQIVDMNGRKLVRVNDIQMILLSSGLYLVSRVSSS